MNREIRKITEGAMMCAIVGVLLLINRQTGNMLEYAMYWILTFPILIYTASYGVKTAIVPSICMLILSIMFGSITTVFYLFSCIVVGFVYGGGVRKGWKNGTLLFLSCVFTFFSYLITTVFFASLFGYDPADDVEMVKMLLNIFHVEHVDLMQTVQVIVLLVAVEMAILQTMCIHMIGNLLLKRLHIKVHPMKSVFQIASPKWTGYLILTIFILFYARNVVKLNYDVSSILFGAFLVSKVYAIACGILCAMCILISWKKQRLIFLFIIGAWIPVIQDGIAILGLFDILFQVRDRISEVYRNGSIRKF